MSDPALLFVQIAVILAVCRALGVVFARLRQPLVVAEMVGGFVLGPSLLGWAAPALHARLFPGASLHTLYVLSQIGLVLYMFCVGLEFRLDLVAHYRRRALAVSAAGIAVPFAFGATLALVMTRSGGFFTPAVRPIQGVLFMGAAMSITAFPVLARIIAERGIGGTTIGSLSLAAGAMDDAAAWVTFAVVLSSVTGNAALAVGAAGGALLYVAITWFGVRPAVLARVAAAADREDALPPAALAIMLALLGCAAWLTDAVGIHSVFGAFVLGASVPRNTRLLLIDSAGLWLTTAVVFLTACAGKGLACWAAARATGATARQALAIATLMNARGMVELILVNLGLQRGLITPTLFTMLVLMAIGTTLMAGPVFSVIWERAEDDAVEPWLAADRVP
ncbi:MAG: cation/H(+) antiporter [Acidobacteria bacterium]|nr:MAG: cation/H(+) antiporter [Acidobacteriota bacterium]